MRIDAISDLPHPASWQLAVNASWSGENRLRTPTRAFDNALYSPFFRAEPGKAYYISLTLEVVSGGVCLFALRRGDPHSKAARASTSPGMTSKLTLRLIPSRSGWHQFGLANFRTSGGASEIRIHAFEVSSIAHTDGPAFDSCLSHWGWLRRWIHRHCAASRTFNTIVAAIEMRLGREELLSLPQYMALCPTGFCNALCSFCSVTQNRGGITKREQTLEEMLHFVGPALRTIRTFGLEGNGEPTLAGAFDPLIDRLGQDGAEIYLITNAERLTPERIERMLAAGVATVNVSLNAATAETHQAVMKLKSFDRVLENIRCLVRSRPPNWSPRISVSMVVTALNIHEVVPFMRLAEQELGVDGVHVRPLSELGNDFGVVEDLRSLVPFSSDVADMIEAVQDYLASTPRRTQINFQPGQFRSVRLDPFDRVVLPLGFSDRLLPPRRSGWTVPGGPAIIWNDHGFSLSLPPRRSKMLVATSIPVPVEPDRSLRCSFRYRLDGSAMALLLIDPAGNHLVRQPLVATDGRWLEVSLHVATSESIAFHLEASPGDLLRVEFDFERLRVPAPGPHRCMLLPSSERWQKASPGAGIEWMGPRRISLTWTGAAGPYLAKSYAIPCPSGSVVSFHLRARVGSGELGCGILDGQAGSWLKTWRFPLGEHRQSLGFATRNNSSVFLVFYSVSETSLAAEAEWDETPSFVPDPEWTSEPETTRPETAAGISVQPVEVAREIPSESGPRRRARRDRHYYCQKPWTDLHSFDVNGRADVCCIATGASQQHYALGDHLTQSFQEIWNGVRMREFRRTVNTSAKLPPCQRCPMAHAYEGPLFSKERTLALLRERIEHTFPWALLNRPFVSVAGFLTRIVLFRRFRP